MALVRQNSVNLDELGTCLASDALTQLREIAQCVGYYQPGAAALHAGQWQHTEGYYTALVQLREALVGEAGLMAARRWSILTQRVRSLGQFTQLIGKEEQVAQGFFSQAAVDYREKVEPLQVSELERSQIGVGPVQVPGAGEMSAMEYISLLDRQRKEQLSMKILWELSRRLEGVRDRTLHAWQTYLSEVIKLDEQSKQLSVSDVQAEAKAEPGGVNTVGLPGGAGGEIASGVGAGGAALKTEDARSMLKKTAYQLGKRKRIKTSSLTSKMGEQALADGLMEADLELEMPHFKEQMPKLGGRLPKFVGELAQPDGQIPNLTAQMPDYKTPDPSDFHWPENETRDALPGVHASTSENKEAFSTWNVLESGERPGFSATIWPQNGEVALNSGESAPTGFPTITASQWEENMLPTPTFTANNGLSGKGAFKVGLDGGLATGGGAGRFGAGVGGLPTFFCALGGPRAATQETDLRQASGVDQLQSGDLAQGRGAALATNVSSLRDNGLVKTNTPSAISAASSAGLKGTSGAFMPFMPPMTSANAVVGGQTLASRLLERSSKRKVIPAKKFFTEEE